MKKAIIICTFFSLLFIHTFVFSTGPSYMAAVIQPILVNPEGLVLCKTKFEQNSEGARRIMPVRYGWALVFPDGKIEEYPDYYFDSDAYPEDTVGAYYEELEKKFNQEIDWVHPPETLTPLLKRYHFNSNNAKEFLVDQKMTRDAFLKAYHLDSKKAVQRTIRGRHSIEYGDTVHVWYIFKNLIFLKNYIEGDNYGNPTGASFDFRFEYRKELMDYDVFEITGVIPIR